MKYETPELTALTAPINAIQGTSGNKWDPPYRDSPITDHEGVVGYADWE